MFLVFSKEEDDSSFSSLFFFGILLMHVGSGVYRGEWASFSLFLVSFNVVGSIVGFNISSLLWWGLCWDLTLVLYNFIFSTFKSGAGVGTRKYFFSIIFSFEMNYTC